MYSVVMQVTMTNGNTATLVSYHNVPLQKRVTCGWRSCRVTRYMIYDSGVSLYVGCKHGTLSRSD
jgi:hypothetical protein